MQHRAVVKCKYLWSHAGRRDFAETKPAANPTGDDVSQGVISSFSAGLRWAPVGSDVQLRCRVTRLDSGNVVELLKKIYATDPARYVLLTTNDRKESSISDIDRYSIRSEPHGDDGGRDFILTITGSSLTIVVLKAQQGKAQHSLSQLINQSVVLPVVIQHQPYFKK